ncbi:MAG: DNA internalization-related competence protein ComEC/Rec2, partial [Actinomycetota bacterium]|nr:DNA internalization-related competence protein ComEC/Rec2 [Actinomycetota bacterium]
VRIDRAALSGHTLDTHLSAWASGGSKGGGLQAGDRVGILGRLQPLGSEGFDLFLRSGGVDARLSVSQVRLLGPSANPLLGLANATRSGLRRGTASALDPRHGGLLLGLAIGETSRMDPEVDADFRASGLGHLLAVSGSNVAMFLAPLIAVGSRLGLRVRGRVALGLVGVVFFALLTRWEPSVLRAGAMAGVALAAAWSGRARSTLPAVCIAVVALLVADPSLALSVGFQLSVGATVGLAILAGPFASRFRWLPRWLALALGATLAAQATVTPLLLLRFGSVPTMTLIANVLAFPAVGVALLSGVAAAGAALLSASGGSLLGRLAQLPLGYLVEVADRTARVPVPGLTSEGPLLPLALAAGVVALAVRLRRERTRIGTALTATSLAVAVWLAAPAAGPPASLTVTFIDVGQGDAAVVRTPDGATILVDAGPEDQQVAVELGRLGVRRIDLAVASHGHADHVEGFPAVFARFPVSLLVEPGCPIDSPAYLEMIRAARDERIPVRFPRGGDRYEVGAVRIEVVGPERCSPIEEPNDDSLVLRLRLGDASVLFSGDAEVQAQEDLLADGDPLVADVLKVPHHGGDTSTPAFFDAVDARVAVVSTGPNDYGHPNRGVLEQLRRAGMVVYRTDLEGDITVSFTRDGGLVVGSERG